jgi:hypothetical protein
VTTTYAQVAIEKMLVIPEVISFPGKEAIVPINMTDVSGVAGADIVIAYNNNILTPKIAKTTFLSDGMKLTFDIKIPGELSLSIKGNEILNGAGPFIEITFVVSNNAPFTDTPITFKEAKIYDASSKEISMIIQDGKVRISGNCLKGDADSDSVITAKDAIIVLRIAAGLRPPTPYEVCACDVNTDGAIRSNDAIIILRMAVGLEPLVKMRF